MFYRRKLSFSSVVVSAVPRQSHTIHIQAFGPRSTQPVYRLDHGTRVISRRDRPFPSSRFASPSPSLVPVTRKPLGSLPSLNPVALPPALPLSVAISIPPQNTDMVHEAPDRETEEMFGGAYPPPRRILLLVWRAVPDHAQAMWFLCFAMHTLRTRVRCRF